jgi:hypothetical protein
MLTTASGVHLGCLSPLAKLTMSVGRTMTTRGKLGRCDQLRQRKSTDHVAMLRGREGAMVIHFFRDEADNDYFAFSVDGTGANIPPATPLTEWIFLETIDTLKVPEQWDITNFQYVLDDLKL